MFTEGKVIECDVVGTTYDETGGTLYQVRPSDSSKQVFVVEPLRFYVGSTLPEKAYCKVIRDEDGKVSLRQDEFITLNRLYLPNRVYSFKVLKQLSDSQRGKRRYLISAIPGYQHIFTSHRDEVFTVGEEVGMLVTIKAYPDGTACLFYKRVLAELSEFSPKALFERCGHGEDYQEFFEGIIRHKEPLRDKDYLIDDMRKKLRDANRLWVFDYLSILIAWLFFKEGNPLDKTERGCKLLRDLDIYLLEENGLIMAFTDERRMETEKKAETSIERAEMLMEACQIVREGRAESYLSAILRSLGNTGYLRDRERRLGILRFIDKMDRDFMDRNIRGFSELLGYVKRWKISSDHIRIIMNRLVYILNARRKAMSLFQIHHYRELPDREELSELVQLMGSVMAVLEAKMDYTTDCTELQDRRIFGELCSLLSLMTTRERGLRLMNKAVAYLVNKATPAPWDRAELFQAGDNPEALIEVILNMPIAYSEGSLMTNTSQVLMRYKEGALALTRVMRETHINQVCQLSDMVYQVPGTCLQALSLQDGGAWPENAPLLFYRDMWKGVLEREETAPSISSKTKGVLIRTKQPNPSFKGLIFCSSVDEEFSEDGAIGYKSYAANFRIPDLTEVFSPNLLLVADVERDEAGHNLFDINRNLMEFSQKKATIGKKVLAHSLYFNKQTGQPFFITTDGVMCRGLSNPDHYYQLLGGYEVEIVDLGGNDFPSCRMVRVAETDQKASSSLRKQLIELSRYNKERLVKDGNTNQPEWCDFPYMHQFMMPYLYLVEGEAALYNTLHILRLIAMKERSLLNNLFSASIQDMELKAARKAGVPFVSSIKDFEITESILEQFPELKSFAGELSRFKATQDVSGNFSRGIKEPSDDTDSLTISQEGTIQSGEEPLMIRFFQDGKYMLGEGSMPGLPLFQASVPDKGYVVLGYGDGHFSKIPSSLLVGLRKGKLLPLSDKAKEPCKVFSLSDEDAVLIRHFQSNVGYAKVVPVRDIPIVSSLHDNGEQLIDLSPSRKVRMYKIKGEPLGMAQFMDGDFHSPGFREDDPQVGAAFEQLLTFLRQKEEQMLLPDERLLDWVKAGAFWRLLYYLEEARLNIVTRNRLGEQMSWLLSETQNGDQFWPVVEALFQRNPRFYIAIIEQALQEKSLPLLSAEGDSIASTIRCILWKTGSLSLVMRLFYPLRSLLRDKEKRVIREAQCDFKIPVLYLQLLEMGGLSVDELKALLLKEDTNPARYAFFELVRRQYETGGITREEVRSYVTLLGGRNARDGFTADLLLMGILQEDPQYFPREGVDRILRGGYQVFAAATKLDDDSMQTFCKGNTRAHLGKTYQLEVERSYKNYYVCWMDKVTIIVPKWWCKRNYIVGQTISLRMERSVDRMRLIYASEEGFAVPTQQQIQLLRVGDRVEFQFEKIGKRLHPELRSELKRLTIIVKDAGSFIVPNYAYNGVVVGQRDETTYYIEMGK